MHPATRFILVAAGLWLAVAAPAASAAETETVYRGLGEGSSNRSGQEALERALRNGLVKVLDQYFETYSKGQEQLWVRRLVEAHPRHVVQKHYDVVRATDAHQDPLTGRWSQTVQLRVPKARLDEAAEEALRFFEALGGGSPTVAIYEFTDRIEENEPWGRRTEHNSRQSWVAQQLEELLQKMQFSVHVIDQVERLRPAQGEFAELAQQDLEVLREIATKQGADIFVVCYAHVIGPEADDRVTPGKVTYFWDATAQAKIYWTDTGRILATIDSKGEEGKTNRYAGRIDALRSAGDNLAPKILDGLFEHWSIAAFDGREFTLTVLGCNASEALKIKKAVQEVIQSTRVQAQPANKTTTIRFKYTGPADELAVELIDKMDGQLTLELMEARYNTMRMQLKH